MTASKQTGESGWCLAMTNQTKMRVRQEAWGTEILTLVSHPMRGGGNSFGGNFGSSARFIERMSISLNGRTIVDIFLSPNIAANPLTSVAVDRVKPGDDVAVTWRDNHGSTGGARAKLK